MNNTANSTEHGGDTKVKLSVYMVRGPVLAAFLLCGCVPPLPTPEQLQISRDHEFPGVSPARAAAALEVVFRASRPGEYETRRATGIVHARLHWHSFDIVDVGAGEEIWSIVIRRSGGGSFGNALRTVKSGDVLVTPTMDLPDEAAAYELLWARADFVLGLRPDWVSCSIYRNTMLPPDYPEMAPRLMCSDDAREVIPSKL